LTVQKDLTLSLGNETVAREALGGALSVKTEGDKQRVIYLRADSSIDYGALMEVMNLLRAAGYLKVALMGLETLAPAQ
jgi:biopolymer transport protein ExbD